MSTNTKTAASFVMMNGLKVNTDMAKVSLAAVIKEMVDATKKEYGSHIRIAAKLNDMMTFDWFDIDAKEDSNTAAVLRPHWKAVLDGFKAAGHSNPSVPAKRIKDYGRNLRAGLAPNGKTLADGSALPEGEGQGDGANPAKRSPMLRNTEELIALFKFNSKLDKPEAKITAAMVHITAALKALGVEASTIKTA